MSLRRSDVGKSAKVAIPSVAAKSPTKWKSLKAFDIGRDQKYISFPFATACLENVHHFPEAENWSAGPYSCLGKNCPACQVGLKRTRLLLLPCVDRTNSEIGVLRLPLPSGPGQLADVLHEALLLQDGAFDVFRITREWRNFFSVDEVGVVPPDHNLAGQIEDFQLRLDRDEVDLTSCLGLATHSDLAGHPQVSASLKSAELADALE